MRALILTALLGLMLAGCGRGQTPEEKQLADSRDVQFVEAAQDVGPPMEDVTPQPITAADSSQSGLGTPRCRFFPESEAGPVLLLMVDTVFLKLEGALRVFAADKGSHEQPFGGWTRYESRQFVIDLQAVGDTASETGEGMREWPGRVTIRDGSDRVLYTRVGTLRCGA